MPPQGPIHTVSLVCSVLVDLGKIDLLRVDLVRVDFERVDLERLNPPGPISLEIDR